jgi:flagellin
VGLRISTNIVAQNAARNLRTQMDVERSSLEKLSSGSRINHASDDAAGLSISEKMRSAIRSTRQAARNTSDGISMVQVAEGAMNEVSNIIIRLRELSIQGASDTLSDTERGFIDKEAQQILSEVDRIGKTTSYNGVPLLNSAPRYFEIQAGIGADPDSDRLYYDVWTQSTSLDRMGLDGVNVTSRGQARSNLDILDKALDHVNKNRANLGALQNRMAAALANSQISADNLTESRSRISDTDYAMETAEMTKNKIQADASLAVLSQANQSGKLALKLLE